MFTSADDMDVLIIEDSVATAGVISDYLRQLDYNRIHICNDGEGNFLYKIGSKTEKYIKNQILFSTKYS